MRQEFGSTVLIKLLRFLDKRLSVNDLRLLLLTQEHTFKRLAYGIYSSKTHTKNLLYWPKHLDWLNNAPDIFAEGAKNKKLGGNYKAKFFQEDKQRLISLEIRAFEILLYCIEAYRDKSSLNLNETRNKIIGFLEGEKVDPQVIDCIRKADDLREIARFLTETAANKGKITEEKKPVYFSSVAMAEKAGLTTEDIAEMLMENDRHLFKNLGSNSGEKVQWSLHMNRYPGNWGLLMAGKRVVGNFSLNFLTVEQEKMYKRGKLTADKKQASEAASESDELAIDLMNLSIIPPYDTDENYTVLWSKLEERLLELAIKGVYFRGVYTCLFDEKKQKDFFIKHGFTKGKARKGSPGARIYYVDFTYGIPEAFSDILSGLYQEYVDNTDKNKITYGFCPSADELKPSLAQEIGALTFATDKYVYRALFNDVSDAKVLFGKLLYMDNDPIFRASNYYIATYKGHVIGIVHYCLGPVKWTSDMLREEAEYEDITLPDTVSLVVKEYFPTYNQTEAQTMSILDLCMDHFWEDKRLGKDLMESFLEKYGDKYDMELHVLVESPAQVDIFRKVGFTSDRVKRPGFSVEKDKPLCYHMKRKKGK